MKRVLLAFLFFQFLFPKLQAQEMWGISNSNYAGSMGLRLNPSAIVGAAYKYDINFVALDIFAQNSYVYVPKSEFVLFKAIGGNLGSERITEDNFNGKNHNAFAHLLVIGPSYIHNKETTAWGLQSAYRNEQSILKAPSHLSKFIYEKYQYPEGYGIRNVSDPFSVAWLDWVEIGGTYGKVLRESEYAYLKAALSVNVLLGFNGSYMKVNTFDY
nr:hypothetical protein [Bacteroidia bacterium]